MREDLATATGNLNQETADPLQLTSHKSFRTELNHYLAEDQELKLRAISHIFVVAFQDHTPNAKPPLQGRTRCIHSLWPARNRRSLGHWRSLGHSYHSSDRPAIA
ncbi:hypothetical protein [Leptolyngbya sp. FACHB-16]|uniref:hypothetical protein n=1 Tax=unclassified Leptolyngbya TaxID=2650499 RepID=UPI0016871342|nr:hypothetical protein [Leptolyngbya sp. FACHB-16]MBD2156146.1 hypothetical protein [Leptolyngbya sp. FACHB-16]